MFNPRTCAGLYHLVSLNNNKTMASMTATTATQDDNSNTNIAVLFCSVYPYLPVRFECFLVQLLGFQDVFTSVVHGLRDPSFRHSTCFPVATDDKLLRFLARWVHIGVFSACSP